MNFGVLQQESFNLVHNMLLNLLLGRQLDLPQRHSHTEKLVYAMLLAFYNSLAVWVAALIGNAEVALNSFI